MKKRLTSSVVAMLVSAVGAITIAAANAQPQQEPAKAGPAKRPTLVVGIVVDGLELDRLELLRDHFGSGGFRRLMEQGVTITDLDYGTPLDAAAATAVLMTGSSPMVNGIPSAQVYNPESRHTQSILLDPSTIGNFTSETLSPKGLQASTLADELRIDAGGLGYVYALAPDPEQAIILGGHAGNSAFWINDLTGKWATTTFYKDLPTPTQNINHRNPTEYRLDTLQWTPLVPLNTLPDLPSVKKLYPFRHSFLRNDPNRFRAYKNSAAVNTDITDLAGEYLRVFTLGSRDATDMLALGYTLQPFIYGRDPDARAEHMDSYLRLDRNLEQLFAAIDREGPGMDHTMVFVAGTPLTGRQRRDDDMWQIPFGEFSSKKAVSLLNMYLMAIYGNGEWVTGYHNGQVFLNRELIKNRNKNLGELRREAADFLIRMAGVNNAWTLDDVLDRRATDNPEARRRNTVISTAGDVFLSIAPGWHEIDDHAATAEPQTTIRATAATAPAFILAPGISAHTISTPVDARVFAPTVAGRLRIRSPNGAALAPLRF